MHFYLCLKRGNSLKSEHDLLTILMSITFLLEIVLPIFNFFISLYIRKREHIKYTRIQKYKLCVWCVNGMLKSGW